MIRLLVIASSITLAIATTPSEAVAQSAICDTVRPGDTASSVARRLTGRADSRRQPWFRIIDRARSRVIPTSRYDRLRVGWQVCVPAARVIPRAPAPGWGAAIRRIDPSTTLRASLQWVAAPQPVASPPAPRDRTLEVVLLFLGPAVFGAAMGFGWESVQRFLAKREALKREMERFGEEFVNDFERPLVVGRAAARPIRSRLRPALGDRRLDILLAPAAGRRYPNLCDHRRNVEYDVDRITHRLKHHACVAKPLRTEGEWVVIPFQFEANARTGAVV